MEPVNTPPASTPPPAPPAAPPAPTPLPPPPQPPVGTPPSSGSFDDGGITKKEYNYVAIGFGILTAAVLISMGVYYIRKARQSKRLADTQEKLERQVRDIEAVLKKMSSKNSMNYIGV